MVAKNLDERDLDDVPTIKDLINERKDSTGESFRQMSDRAARHDLHVKHQTLAELAKENPKQWPKNTGTITALAAALGVTERTVILAFARSFGFEVGQGRDVFETALPRDLLLLPRDTQFELIKVVQDFVNIYLKAGEGHAGSAPMNSGDGPQNVTDLSARQPKVRDVPEKRVAHRPKGPRRGDDDGE